MNYEPVHLDRQQAFLIFTTFAGDVVRTAHALGLREIDIQRVADDEGWLARIAPIIELVKSTRPGDFERGCNRAVNYSQAHRLRLFLERVLHRLTGMKPEEVEEYLFHGKTKEGDDTRKLTTRALADLASAVEKAHALTYLALGDTSQDRSRRKEGQSSEDSAAGEIHAKIAEAMAKAGASNTPRAKLLDAQLVVVENLAESSRKPENPYDKD